MKLLSSKECLRTEIFAVTEDIAVDPDGFQIRRQIVQHAGSAVMIPVDDKGRVLLVRQYRLPVRQHLWELPAGRLDPGEKPLEAARRELREETGYKARRWDKLLAFYPSPGYVSEKMTVYLARDLREGEAQPMGDERIECRWFTIRELDRMLSQGQILDAKTLIGLSAWKRLKRSLP